MENSLEFATINWLTATPSIKFHLNDDCPQYARSAIPMDEKIGHGWLEITPLAIGMYLTHVHYHFTDQMYGQTVVLHSMQGELKEPTLIITSPKIGRVGHKDYCVGGVYAFGAGQTLFKLVDRIDHQPTFDASSEIEVTILGVGMSVLRDFLGNELSGVLLEKLRLPHCRDRKSVV